MDLSLSVESFWIVLLLFLGYQKAECYQKKKEEYAPEFINTTTNINVHVGEVAILPCHIRDLGPKMVVWQKVNEDNPLSIGASIFTQEEGSGMAIDRGELPNKVTTFDLLIKNVQLRHNGTYECRIVTTKLFIHYVSLHVSDGPVYKQELVLTGTKYVNQYDKIHLTCNATGAKRAPESVDWFFKGTKIKLSQKQWYDRTRILRKTQGHSFISELIIERSTGRDQGKYVCRSSDLDIDGFRVDVLNAGKENVDRRHLPDSSGNQQFVNGASICLRIPCSFISSFLLILYFINR